MFVGMWPRNREHFQNGASALGGAAVNYAFIDHFQDVARGHFAIRRLERTYGKDIVRAEYDRAREQLAPTRAAEPVG